MKKGVIMAFRTFTLRELGDIDFCHVSNRHDLCPILSDKKFRKIMRRRGEDWFRNQLAHNFASISKELSQEQLAMIGYQYGGIHMDGVLAHSSVNIDIPRLLTMIRHSTEYQTGERIGWNMLLDYVRSFSQLRFGLSSDDWDIAFDVTSSASPGKLVKSGIFSDAPTALILKYKSKDCLMIGCIPDLETGGVLIVQIQSLKKRGNRALYQIKKGGRINEAILPVFQKAFPSVSQVDGESLWQRYVDRWEAGFALDQSLNAWNELLVQKSSKGRYMNCYDIPSFLSQGEPFMQHGFKFIPVH